DYGNTRQSQGRRGRHPDGPGAHDDHGKVLDRGHSAILGPVMDVLRLHMLRIYPASRATNSSYPDVAKYVSGRMEKATDSHDVRSRRPFCSSADEKGRGSRGGPAPAAVQTAGGVAAAGGGVEA